MNDQDKDAIAEITRQVMEAVRLLRDAAVRLWDMILERARIVFSRMVRTDKRPSYIRFPPNPKRLGLNAVRQQSGCSIKIERAHQTNQRHPALRRIGGARHGKG